MRRNVLAPLMMGIGLGLISGCGVSYPGDRADWALVETPHEVAGGSIDGSITFLETGEARMLESLDNKGLDQLRFLSWTGTWEGGRDGAEVALSCSDATFKNVDEDVDCTSATLTLSCSLVGDGLDCGDYGFR